MNLGRIHLLWSHHSVSSPLLQPGPGTRHFDMLTMKKGANILLVSVMQIKLTAVTNWISFLSKSLQKPLALYSSSQLQPIRCILICAHQNYSYHLGRLHPSQNGKLHLVLNSGSVCLFLYILNENFENKVDCWVKLVCAVILYIVRYFFLWI